MEDLIGQKEAARLLGISTASFYRIARKHIPAIKLTSQAVKFDRRDVEAFALSRKELVDAK